MANIKSAKKRILVNRTKADRNKAISSSVKTAMKKVFAAVEVQSLQTLPRLLRWQVLRVFTIRTTLLVRFPV